MMAYRDPDARAAREAFKGTSMKLNSRFGLGSGLATVLGLVRAVYAARVAEGAGAVTLAKIAAIGLDLAQAAELAAHHGPGHARSRRGVEERRWPPPISWPSRMARSRSC